MQVNIDFIEGCTMISINYTQTHYQVFFFSHVLMWKHLNDPLQKSELFKQNFIFQDSYKHLSTRI